MFDFALPRGIFFMFHQLPYILEVGLSKFVAVHGDVNIQFFNLGQNLRVFILPLFFLFFLGFVYGFIQEAEIDIFGEIFVFQFHNLLL